MVERRRRRRRIRDGIRRGASRAGRQGGLPLRLRGRWFGDRDVRGLAEGFAFREAETMREAVETSGVGGSEHREAFGSVAVGPRHVMRFLARGFHEIAKEGLIVGGKIHRAWFGRRSETGQGAGWGAVRTTAGGRWGVAHGRGVGSSANLPANGRQAPIRP